MESAGSACRNSGKMRRRSVAHAPSVRCSHWSEQIEWKTGRRHEWRRGTQECVRHKQRSKKRSIEGPREEIFHLELFGFAVEVGESDLDVAAKLPDNLTAGAAGRSEKLGVGSHGDAAKFARAFRDCFPNGDAFGAYGEAVGRVFDVAAGENAAVFGFERRADQEMGERCVGVLAGGDGGFGQSHS